jgi:Flp pilus assembly protein TadD
VIAHAEILAQLDRPADAAALVGEVARDAGDPGLAALGDRLAAGEPIPWTSARNATEGMAEVFFTLALALNGEADPGYTLLYARIAAWLRPDHAEAVLLAASMLEEQQQFDLAVETYTAIPPDNASAFAAEIGRARALEAAGRGEAAVEVLRAVARGYPDLLSVHVALGDALRRMERWDEAAPVYETAVVLLGTPQPEHWSLFFSRAIVFERMKVWDRAEPDFRQALALNPDQPQVLNYLGYSFLEQNRNLDEALGMIERAVAQSPDSGYIVDSLAWGLFRLGRYAEAVEPMERASLLEPVDPVVTDHLGDIYWAVGRKMEARFQWRRALSFGPEEKEAARIRRKLEVGLDAVLAEEGLPSLAEVAARSGVPDAN